MLLRNVLRVSFRRVVGGGVGLLIILSIGSSLIRSAHSAQTRSSQQDRAGASGAAPSVEEAQALEQGRSFEREISIGQSHSYRITLNAGQYLRVHVEQQGIDVTVALLEPDGKVVAESKSDNGNFGPEIVSMIAEEPVEVRLEVRPPDWESPAGRYEVKIADRRIATNRDRKRVDAERAFAEGEWLLEQGTAESIRKFLAESLILLNLRSVYRARGETQKALDYLDRGLRLNQVVGPRRVEANIQNNIAAGEKQKALDYFNKSLVVMLVSNHREGVGALLNNIANIYSDLGENQKAIDTYTKSLAIERDRGNLTEALGKIEAALEIVESLRIKIDDDNLRASYLGETRNYYEMCIDLLMRLHRIDPSKNHAVAAFQSGERSRARALIETLAESRAEIRKGVDPELLASERALQKRLESKKDRLIRLLGGKHTEESADGSKSEPQIRGAERKAGPYHAGRRRIPEGRRRAESNAARPCRQPTRKETVAHRR